MKEFLAVYQKLNKNNLHLLDKVYAENIQFVDPVHKINGIKDMKAYFAGLYQNLESINFLFHHALEAKDEGYVQWDMTFIHRKLAGTRPITVTGVTYLRLNDIGKVMFHRDYFDLGAMVYEQLPLLGRLITSIKRRLGK